MWLRLSERAKKAITFAQDDARLSPDLLLIACLRESGGVVAKMLAGLGIDIDPILGNLEAITPDPGNESDEIVESAEAEARSMRSPYIGTEHLLLALLKTHNSQAAAALTDAGIGYEAVLEALGAMKSSKNQ